MISNKDRCIIAFNRFLTDFLRDINHASPDIKRQNRHKYRSIESCSSKYVEFFIEKAVSAGTFTDIGKHLPSSLFDQPSVYELEVIEGLTVEDLFKTFRESKIGLLPIKEYIILFLILANLVFNDNVDDIDSVLTKIAHIQDKSNEDSTIEKKVDEEDVEKCNDEDYLLKVLANIHTDISDDEEDDDDSNNESNEKTKNPDFNIDPKMLENTTIGAIAKEVAQELDMQNMGNISSIEDVFKTDSNGTNIIGNIVSKLGDKLQNKLSTGKTPSHATTCFICT